MRFAALALLVALFAAPSYASDASTDRSVGDVLEKVKCKDSAWPGCAVCVHVETQQFEFVGKCDVEKPKPPAKKGK